MSCVWRSLRYEPANENESVSYQLKVACIPSLSAAASAFLSVGGPDTAASIVSMVAIDAALQMALSVRAESAALSPWPLTNSPQPRPSRSFCVWSRHSSVLSLSPHTTQHISGEYSRHCPSGPLAVPLPLGSSESSIPTRLFFCDIRPTSRGRASQPSPKSDTMPRQPTMSPFVSLRAVCGKRVAGIRWHDITHGIRCTPTFYRCGLKALRRAWRTAIVTPWRKLAAAK